MNARFVRRHRRREPSDVIIEVALADGWFVLLVCSLLIVDRVLSEVL